MSVQCAARFTPPPVPEPSAERGTAPRAPGPFTQRGLGPGAALLLSSGAAASAWALPATAHAQFEQTAPEEDQQGGPRPEAHSPDVAASMPVSPLWSAAIAAETPARPAAAAAPAAPTASERIQDRLAESTLCVRGGESLWSLTGQLLGPNASEAEIARSWPLLWEANADQIHDPDRVAAGTVLHVPPRLLPES